MSTFEPDAQAVLKSTGSTVESFEVPYLALDDRRHESFSEVQKEDEHVIPDGGLRAWLTVAGSSLVLMCTFGYGNSFGVFQAAYVQEFLPNHSASEIAWIGTIQLFLLFGMGIPCGMLFDARKFHWMTISGSVLLVSCCFALSAAQPGQYYQFFLAQGLGQGIGMGLLYLPAVAVLSHHFEKRRALASGFVFMGSGVGGVIFPILINNVSQSHGFVTSVRATGYVLLGGLALANLLMRPHYNPSHKAVPRPKMKKLLTDRPYLFGSISACCAGFGIFFPFFYIQLFSITLGLDQNFSFYTISIINASSAFGRFVPALVADRFGPVTSQAPSIIISSGLTFVLLGIKTQSGVIAFCILYGFFSGAVVSMFPPIVALMADTMAEVGIRMGVAFFVFSLACLTGNPIVGALIGYGPYDWWRGIVFSGICLGCSGGFTLVSRWFLQQKKGVKWV
ncbi:MFS general substrate transporter [Dacryopinax primogenitus]|uniref:MFS general substrate transporter n=1 Tax=Dacryopinax primogenitus (strain DJM 731) TaxID=1858805 RepID=M5G5E9_DACPD|nr:MFS general substrate transporter [Dacryopinax primogenitus]EJU01047.1 MFS general substrate transporter [Dacryopinax primogenitus]